MTSEPTPQETSAETTQNALEAIDGLWTVSSSRGEAYEQSYDTVVGLFPSEAAADAYIAAFEGSRDKVYEGEYNTSTYVYWKKNFVPTAPTQVPDVRAFYEVETSRSYDKNGQREIECVKVSLIDVNQPIAYPAFRHAFENPGKAFQQVSKHGEPEEFLESSEFPAMVLSDDKQDWEGTWETFYSITKDAVVLTPPEGYVHPEPIPWEQEKEHDSDGYHSEELAEWERELLGYNDEKTTEESA